MKALLSVLCLVSFFNLNLYCQTVKQFRIEPIWEFIANMKLPDKNVSETKIRYSHVSEYDLSVYFGHTFIYKSDIGSRTYTLVNNKSYSLALSPINDMYISSLPGNEFILKKISNNDSLFHIPKVNYGRNFSFTPDGNYLIVLDFLNSYEKDITIFNTKDYRKEFYTKFKDNSSFSSKNIIYSKDSKSLMIHSNLRVQPEPFTIPNTRIFIDLQTMIMKRDSLYDFNIHRYIGNDKLIASLKSKPNDYFIYDFVKYETVKYLKQIYDSTKHKSLQQFFANDKLYQFYTVSEKNKEYELTSIDYQTDDIELYKLSKPLFFGEVYESNDTILIKRDVSWYYYRKQEINSIENTKQMYNLTISPNPTDGKLKIGIDSESFGNTKISILDLTGKEVYTNNIKLGSNRYELNLNLEQLPQGNYTLVLTQGDYQLATGKFIINK